MSYDTITLKVRQGIQRAIRALELPGFSTELFETEPADIPPGAILRRINPTAEGCKSPAIILSPTRNARGRSPAGLRTRIVNVIATFYWKPTNTSMAEAAENHHAATQEYCVERVAALFDLPSEMPTMLTALVPEVEECRIVQPDNFIPAAYRNDVDVHRMVIAVEVCQLAGVV